MQCTSTWDQNVWNRWIWLDTTCLIIHTICNRNIQYVLSPNCAINTDRSILEFCGCNHSFCTSLTMPSLNLQDANLQIMAMAVVLGPGLVTPIPYTNSLVKADSFYANFTNTTFQNIPIPHLTRHPMRQKFLH